MMMIPITKETPTKMMMVKKIVTPMPLMVMPLGIPMMTSMPTIKPVVTPISTPMMTTMPTMTETQMVMATAIPKVIVTTTVVMKVVKWIKREQTVIG